MIISKEIWRRLGLKARIDEALHVDPVGSAIMEGLTINQSGGDMK